VFTFAACSSRPTDKGSRQQPARDDYYQAGDNKQAVSNDSKTDGDNKHAAQADGNGAREKKPKKELLVGTWEVTTEGVAPGLLTMEFTRDGKMAVKFQGKTITKGGTYQFDGDAIKTTSHEGKKEVKHTYTIITLNDRQLVATDETGKKETYRRK